jgi:dienelactone hydrolase
MIPEKTLFKKGKPKMKLAMFALIAALGLLMTLDARAEIRSQTVEYKQGDATLEGFVAFDDSIASKRPVIVIAHQWKGLSEYEKERARMLARLGYVAFAADIYGKGVRPSDPKVAAAEAGKYKKDRELLRSRMQAAVEAARKRKFADGSQVAAIGYCFGGTAVLELARSGANVKGVASFHGELSAANTNDARNIKAKVLVLHGADDPFAPLAQVHAFEDEMRGGGADWQLALYGGAVHSFTDWNAKGSMKGAEYNEKADRRSWQAMRDFFAEIFRKQTSAAK